MVYSTSKLCAVVAGVGIATLAFANSASAAQCPVSHAQLRAALQVADGKDTSGFNNHSWGVVVNTAGIVCAVAYSGANLTSICWDSSSTVAGLAKRAIDAGLDLDLGAGLRLEQDLFVESFRTEDSQIGVASFREHGPGKATFTGR